MSWLVAPNLYGAVVDPEVAGDLGQRLAGLQHPLNGLGLELRAEPSALLGHRAILSRRRPCPRSLVHPTATAGTGHRSSSKTSTTVPSPTSPKTNRQNPASTEPGAVQFQAFFTISSLDTVAADKTSGRRSPAPWTPHERVIPSRPSTPKIVGGSKLNLGKPRQRRSSTCRWSELCHSW